MKRLLFVLALPMILMIGGCLTAGATYVVRESMNRGSAPSLDSRWETFSASNLHKFVRQKFNGAGHGIARCSAAVCGFDAKLIVASRPLLQGHNPNKAGQELISEILTGIQHVRQKAEDEARSVFDEDDPSAANEALAKSNSLYYPILIDRVQVVGNKVMVYILQARSESVEPADKLLQSVLKSNRVG